ncbi:NAD-dependent succinate-semialdehyde dehydrogenase [Deinococcus roseus]|uniref:NAD-dependent succinate-semialdehyde dehydrogenase n=1 Tax=Deinococcus roseus TaxID=392414 RepID=A0ABQ2CX76_9DEIO|nr:NAD-dependent succinate-semialdehyde dehydrogenase [Deinococcus roseus]GGJ29880.1 NAD-dependent succinate-semialdehyde dehydrogenase [Deinococcus roseus]
MTTQVLDYPTQAYINGQWISTGRTFTISNPATAEKLFEVADCGAQQAEAALQAALEGYKVWKKVNPFERGKIIAKWAALMHENSEKLARIMTLEMGKPIIETRGEVKYAASFAEWYAEEGKRNAGEMLHMPFDHKRAMARYEPVGVCYAVTPWNFPAGMVTRKVAPALAAGCVMVLKPAEQSPVTALYLAELWEEAGGPKGTFQVLPALDPVPVSKPFIDSPDCRKITFTGSTEVGRILYAQAAQTLKRISFELGGHAPFIIFPDADLDLAVKEVMLAKYRNAGQTCVCINRLYVHEDIAEAFTAKLVEKVKTLKVGNPIEQTTSIGPLVEEQGLKKVQRHVQDAVDRGATLDLGGESLGGLFYAPTVLSNVTADMLIMNEETFGPVAAISTFKTTEEAIELANNTPFGLAAYLWTKDIATGFKVSEALDYGIVGVNDGVPSAASPHVPFGGTKFSGVGREGGIWGLMEYLEVKLVSYGLYE